MTRAMFSISWGGSPAVTSAAVSPGIDAAPFFFLGFVGFFIRAILVPVPAIVKNP
jgi:hypothetical protein